MPLGVLADPSPWQDKESEKHRGRFYGRYMGIVKDRNDPERRGRIRVAVPAIFPGSDSRSQSWLDWCLPATVGLAVPPLGSTVWIEFEHGQIQYGVYTWGWIRGSTPADSEAPNIGKEYPDATVKAQIRADAAGQGIDFGATITADTALANVPVYPYNKVFTSEGGHTFEMDDSPNRPRFRYSHPKGTSILVDPDGSVHVRTGTGAVYYECGGDFAINLKAGSTFKVVYPNGSSMAVGASGFVVTGHQANIIGRLVRKNGDAI